MAKPVNECKTVSELLESPARWTRGAFARDERGMDVSADSKEAVCWCVVGAIKKIYGQMDMAVINKLMDVAGESVLTFNDFGHHAKILEKVRAAGI